MCGKNEIDSDLTNENSHCHRLLYTNIDLPVIKNLDWFLNLKRAGA